MPVLGTKQFWMPSQGSTKDEKTSQILKNSGYISIQLYSVNYQPEATFWQKTFGGADVITLSSNLKYQSGVSNIEAASVQDVRKVKARKSTNLALQRNIAVKIPATADALSLDVAMTAIKNDTLQAKFEMMNKPEFQSAFQLAPLVVGQVITITSLVKQLLSNTGKQEQLEASYAGIIGLQPETNPVSQGRLTAGYLLLINDPFDGADVSRFSMKGTSLYYDGHEVENTYIIFNISFDSLKGDNQAANWFKKYNEALTKLDNINTVEDPIEIDRIYNDAKKLWIEGNVLLEADDTYIHTERIQIKAAAFKTINDYYQMISNGRQGNKKDQAALTVDVLNELAGSSSPESVQEALPAMSSLLGEAAATSDDITPINLGSVLSTIDEDVSSYITGLEMSNNSFSLGRLT